MDIFTHTSGKYLDIDDAKIYFEELGNKGKPVLLLLHGGFGNIETFNNITPYLVGHFYIIGIDSRGHGKSTLGSEKLTYKQLQSDVELIIKHLGINTLNIIGFSDGGIIAYHIAANKNIQVDKLITIGSSWREQDIIEVEEMYSKLTLERAKELFTEDYLVYQKLNLEPNFNKFHQAVISMWLDKTETGHPNELVKDITSQTLIVRGDQDFLVSLDSLQQLKTELISSSLLNVPSCGHAVHEEQPEIMNIMLKQFLKY